MKFEDWLSQQNSREDIIGEMARKYEIDFKANLDELQKKAIILNDVSFNPIKGDVKMEASVNQYCGAEALLKDKCIDVGLESIASAQRTGYAAEATSQHGFNHVDGTAQRMAIAELDAINNVGDDVCDSSRDLMRDIHGTDNHLSGSVERLGLFNAGVTERNADKTQAEVERFGLSELEAIRNAEKYLFAGMSQNAKDILLKSCADTSSIKDQSASQFKDLLLQNAENAKDAAITACTNVKDLIILGDKHYSQIQIEALKNKEELARQIAECCCEQKALTIEKANDTQQLVRELDKERLRDELAKTREELIALRVRATLPPALTGSITI
jgi:hypothetical protein